MKEENELQNSNHAVEEAVDRVRNLPPKEQEMAISKLEMYSGPIPHPDILKKYNELDPGAAKLIIENGVEESRYRRELEDKALEYQRRDVKRRDIMGFTIGVMIISVGAFLIYKGHTVVGTVLSGVSAIGLVSLFIGDSSQNENSHNNDEE